MTTEQRQKILEGAWRSVGDAKLKEWLLSGEFTIMDFERIATTEKERERIANIKKSIAGTEKEMWNDAVKQNKVEGYRGYLAFFGEQGQYAEEARRILEQMDSALWTEVYKKPTKEGLEKYATQFPDGLFKIECQTLLDDLPWYAAKARAEEDLSATPLNQYEQQYPNKHSEEIRSLKEYIQDERDWNIACKTGGTQAYEDYLEKHPRGRHADEAQERIKNGENKNIIIKALKQDINAYPVTGKEGIKTALENNSVTIEDLQEVFSDSEIEAIQNYDPPKQLPKVTDTSKTPRNYTEIYFWGLRGTGKTCAIGSTIGYLKRVRKSLNPLPCPGSPYLAQLENLFNNNGNVCSLPPGTEVYDEKNNHPNLPAMAFSFKDTNKKMHKAMLIDVAGEVFSGIFKIQQAKQLGREINIDKGEKVAIDRLKECLNDNYNHKIHFFIIEYGKDDILSVDGFEVSKSQIMRELAAYFHDERMFKRSSVSMNVLVTKCDRITDGDRGEKVRDYLENSGWASVIEGFNQIAKESRSGHLDVKSFSIGKVFAQDLCIYDPTDAEKIVKTIEEHTTPTADNWFSRFIDSLRG